MDEENRAGRQSRHPQNRLERLRRSNLDWSARQARKRAPAQSSSAWTRETWTLPRLEAREKAREFLRRYPRAAYWSEVESWRVLDDDRIEFTMRRLPSAD